MHFSAYVLVLVLVSCVSLSAWIHVLTEYDSVMHSAKLLLAQYGSVMYSTELILVGKSSVIKTAC